MTLEALNKFTAETEAAMTEQERREWFALNEIERKAAAYAAFILLNT